MGGKAGVLPGSILRPWWDRRCARCAHGWRAPQTSSTTVEGATSQRKTIDHGGQGPKLVTLASMPSAINVLECLALRAIASAQNRPSGQWDGGAANALTPMPS